MKDKRKRDFEIRLLKGDLEKRKKYPLGVPAGPSPEELQEQRERDAEKARKDAEHRLKCKQAEENHPLMVYMREVRANLAIDPDYFRKLEAAKPKRPSIYANAITPEMQRKIRAAMDRAEAAGRPITKLTVQIIRDIMNGTLQLFSPFSQNREKSFPKTPVFPTLGKGSKLARSYGPPSVAGPPSVHPSVHHQSDGHVGHNNRVPYPL